MILVYTTAEKVKSIQRLIDSEERLNELVTVSADASTYEIMVADEITLLPDWRNFQPPVLYPTVAFAPEILLGLIYARLGNIDRASVLFRDNDNMSSILNLQNAIAQSVALDQFVLNNRTYVEAHNKSIALHYGTWNQYPEYDAIKTEYERAMNASAASNLFSSFTVKHYAHLLCDGEEWTKAEEILTRYLQNDLPLGASIELKYVLCRVLVKQLKYPLDVHNVTWLKKLLNECVSVFEKQARSVEVAILLTEATYVAMVDETFAEGLGYANKAIKIFENEELSELAAQAQLRKADLLKLWALKGNPHFFKQALTSYQAALKLFTRENTPETFADIQHQLGIIYSQIPDEAKKKSVWAAVSVSSFRDALNYFVKENFPYRYAQICNDFGNAYTKFPQGVYSDNYDRALQWYNEALQVQNAEQYPIERTLTLHNYLEASWLVGNPEEFNAVRYEDMVSKTQEILVLTTDEDIKNIATEYLVKLATLKRTNDSKILMESERISR